MLREAVRLLRALENPQEMNFAFLSFPYGGHPLFDRPVAAQEAAIRNDTPPPLKSAACNEQKWPKNPK